MYDSGGRFRELPESIFAPELVGIVDGMMQTGEQCAELCYRLPEPNRTVVLWLLDLIVDLCRHESDNRMTAQVCLAAASRAAAASCACACSLQPAACSLRLQPAACACSLPCIATPHAPRPGAGEAKYCAVRCL